VPLSRANWITRYGGRPGNLSLPIQYASGVHTRRPSLRGLAITLGDEQIQPRNLVEAMERETLNQEITATVMERAG